MICVTKLNEYKRIQRRCIEYNALKSAAMYSDLIQKKEAILDEEENIYDLVMLSSNKLICIIFMQV